MARVILSAGHGGSDAGNIYDDRREKDDNLRLTFAVGNILSSNNVDVYYLRVSDVFVSPVLRADNANELGADLLVGIHRGLGPFPNSSSGARAFVYKDDGINVEAAENVLENLQEIGFNSEGIVVCGYIYLLRYTNIPSFEIAVGYINTDYDNELFDTRFDDIANAIAYGIIEALESYGILQ